MRLLNYFFDIFVLFKNDNLKNKFYFFSIYNYLFLKNILGYIFNFKSEKILGYRIYFENYHYFFGLFVDMFINTSHFFDSKKNSPFIIDCGANIGIATLYFKYLYPNSKIECYEPDPLTFEILTKNIEENNLKDVKLFCKAVSNKNGKTFFYSQVGIIGSPLNSLFKSQLPSKNMNKFKVDLFKFEKKNFGEIEYIKMDIEGSEGSVFESFDNENFLNIVKNICLEYHYDTNISSNKLSNILNILEKNNFEYTISSNGFSISYFLKRYFLNSKSGSKYILIIDCFRDK